MTCSIWPYGNFKRSIVIMVNMICNQMVKTLHARNACAPNPNAFATSHQCKYQCIAWLSQVGVRTQISRMHSLSTSPISQPNVSVNGLQCDVWICTRSTVDCTIWFESTMWDLSAQQTCLKRIFASAFTVKLETNSPAARDSFTPVVNKLYRKSN